MIRKTMKRRAIKRISALCTADNSVDKNVDKLATNRKDRALSADILHVRKYGFSVQDALVYRPSKVSFRSNTCGKPDHAQSAVFAPGRD